MATAKSPQGTGTRISIVLASITAALSLVGNFLMWAPTLLIFIAWFAGAWEVAIWSKGWNRRNRILSQVGVACIVAGLLYVSWFVFKISMRVRLFNGYAVVANGIHYEQIKIAVKVTNIGKATSLTSWKATLVTAHGKSFPGVVQRLTGESIEMGAGNGLSEKYALPDCDLAFETTRAVQTGDSVFGIFPSCFKQAANLLLI